MPMYQDMGIGGVCSIKLADLTQLYLYASGMYSIGQAGLMQPCCLHCTGDTKADTDMQRHNTAAHLHLHHQCSTESKAAASCCCESVVGCCVSQGGQPSNRYTQRNAKVDTFW
jgi:hypothetical protein